MAKPSAGVRIVLDGETEFRRALSNINAGLRVNKSEMDLLTAKYSKNADSIEALTAKGEAFENQTLTQIDKISILEQAIASSTKAYGEADKRTMEYQASLNKANSELIKLTESQEENDQAINKAKTDLAKMNTELDENQDTLKKTSKETSKLDGLLKGLSDKMGINLPPAFSRMADGLNSTTGKSLALVGAIGSIVVGLGKMTLETSKVADDLLTLSSTSGMTTDQLQELRYASELVDVSVETMDGSMTKLIRSMDDANKGNKEQMAAFRELRISYRDSSGQLKDSNEVFFSTIDALGKVTNETERDALAMTLLGKSARDLNPLIEAGSGKLKELGEEAHAVGYVMDSETLNSFGAMDDSLQRMKNQMQAVKLKLSEVLLPAISGLLNIVTSVPGPVWAVIGVLTAVIGTILGISKAITVISAASTILAGTNFVLGASFMKLLPVILLISAAVAGLVLLWLAFQKGTEGATEDIKKIKNESASFGNNLNNQVNSRSTQNAGSRIPPYALGTAYHSGGFARVNDRQNDPTSGEIIDLPTGSRVYPKGVSPSSGGDIFNITIDAKNVKDFNDIVTMAQAARQQRRSR